MRYSTAILPLVATATAVIVPDEAMANQLVLETEQQQTDEKASWWDNNFPNVDGILSSVENSFETAISAFEKQAGKLSDFLSSIEVEIGSEISDFLPSDAIVKRSETSAHHDRGTNMTIYQTIHASNYTKRFAAMVDDYPDMVDKLNSTSINVTAFIPTNRAFEKIPDHGKGRKPPKEFIEKILQYHILDGFYPAGRVLGHHTLPTALKSAPLGGRPQRLRVSAGLFGVRLNFYSKIVYANLATKNGMLHGVDSILVPPPPARRLISLFPSKFSTLELAAEKTGFAHHKESAASANLTGLTVFAPTNRAFEKLGPAANAFLFNSEKGLGYLKALLAYHVVVNETLYSDAYYGKQKGADLPGNGDDEGEEELSGKASKHYHVDLPTLLGDKHIAVDISRWFGFIKMTVNGRVGVAVQDGVAYDGVLQVVDSILIPPHAHKGFWDADEISVEELVERLSPFVEQKEAKTDGVSAGEL